jgi:hypothetical protein
VRQSFPERLGFRWPDGESQHLAAAFGVGAGSDYHGDIDDAAALAHLHVGGIDPHIAPLAFDRPVEESLHTLVDLLDQPRYLAF